jgi:hypothetical protein
MHTAQVHESVSSSRQFCLTGVEAGHSVGRVEIYAEEHFVYAFRFSWETHAMTMSVEAAAQARETASVVPGNSFQGLRDL